MSEGRSRPVRSEVDGAVLTVTIDRPDLRIAARDATLGVFNRRFGVPLIDLGTVRLPRMVGQGRALDLILTGRPVAAEEALRIGLVERLVEPGAALAEAQSIARQIAAFPQAALRGDRRSALDQWSLGLEEAMRAEYRGGVTSSRPVRRRKERGSSWTAWAGTAPLPTGSRGRGEIACLDNYCLKVGKLEQAVIEAKGLVKKYGDLEAVAGIDLEVYGGEIFGFLGPNGAGKSTTISMLCTLLTPTSGIARVAGIEDRKSVV